MLEGLYQERADLRCVTLALSIVKGVQLQKKCDECSSFTTITFMEVLTGQEGGSGYVS